MIRGVAWLKEVSNERYGSSELICFQGCGLVSNANAASRWSEEDEVGHGSINFLNVLKDHVPMGMVSRKCSCK